MRFSCITVGYKSRADDAIPEILAGPEVPYAEQEAVLDAAARQDEGGEYVRIEIWYRSGQLRSVEFSTAEEKARSAAALNAAAAETAAAERAKASQREALLKQAEALGFDRTASEAEIAKAREEAKAAIDKALADSALAETAAAQARAEADAAKAELAALKAGINDVTRDVVASQGLPPGGGEAHNLEQEGSTPSPATSSLTTPDMNEEAEPRADVPGLADAPGPASSPSPPPVSGKKKSS